MTAQDFTRRLANYAFIAGCILFLPAVVSAVLAAWSAIVDGQITLYNIGKTSTARETVPWQQGWSRLLSPIVLLVGGLTYPGGGNPSAARLLLFIGLATAGSAMLVLSLWFKTLNGALALSALLFYVALAHFVDARFGRKVSTLLLVATALFLLYAYAAAQPLAQAATHYGSHRLAAPGHRVNCPSAASRRLPPRSP